MRTDVIDIVIAEDLEAGDFIDHGEVLRVEEDGEDFVIVYTDEHDDEGVRLRWDAPVKLYGDVVEDV